MTLSISHPLKTEVLRGTVDWDDALVWLTQRSWCRIPNGWELLETEASYVGLLDEEGTVWDLQWEALPTHARLRIETQTPVSPGLYS